MLLNFEFKNFRSFKNASILTLEANSSDQKRSNFSQIENIAGQEFKVLKTAIIYGANASGKSNTMRALFEILNLIWDKPDVDDELRIFDPFRFDAQSKLEQCQFSLSFLGPQKIKYDYSVKILDNIILEEKLDYYPKGKVAKLFHRSTSDDTSERIQKVTLAKSIGGKQISIFKNQLLLSKFGNDEPHDLLTEVYLYFKSYEVINPTRVDHTKYLKRKINELLFEDIELKRKVQILIREADTKVLDIDIEKIKEKSTESHSIRNNLYMVFGIHHFYDNDKLEENVSIPLSEESTGTQSLYILGAKVLSTIKNGGVLIVDELDTSLHPFITKMIVMLFQSESVNTKNAQLIFTTHDVSLLDRDLIRRDQVWITEKNDKGYSDLFSLQDFEGLREDTPFEKWYLAGKFGGLPSIKSVDAIFD